ncbi:pentapeptide repeat-containing protein [Campylobacter coli]|uniref:pentapeptide repeat-containing protein n=2 Tax=Campylobacter coli TaxID=195 RepID=UPI00092E3B06
MMKKTLEKILNTLEKCCEETHRINKSKINKNKIKMILSEVLSINEQNIFVPSHKETKETIKEIKGKEDFRQGDELFSDDEKWYLICDEGGGKIDISLSYDKIKSIPCNVIFNNCNIDLRAIKLKDLKKDNAETIKNHLYFYNCTFENLLIKLKNIIFEKTLTFNQCAFYNDLDIHQNQFLDHLVFINCSNEQNDKKIISLDLKENEFEGYLFIKNCTIENINLWKNKFKNRCYFVDSKFGYKDNQKKLNFSNTHFEDEVYFNNSEFSSYADFHECKFDNIACFYGVKFYKAPNFSACYFKEQKAANLINVDIDELNFESVEKYIEDNYQDETYENKQEITEEQRSNNCKLKCAKHLKDSFRVIKDILITQNNTLEAQEWHKLELYAKEKEIALKIKCINDNIEQKNNDNGSLKQKLYKLTEWVNFTLLFLYRNITEHHTKFLRILGFTFLMIVSYAVFLFLVRCGIFIQLSYDCVFVAIVVLPVIILFLSSMICCMIFRIDISHLVLIVLFSSFIFLRFLFDTIEYILMDFYILLLISFGYCFVLKNPFVNFCISIFSYIGFLIVLITKPQLINPFTGVFSSDKLYESKFEKSLNDLNASAIINLASILQNDFNLHLKDQNISFTELNSAKALIVANKENLLKLNDVNSNIAKEVLGEEYTHTINQDKIIENTIKSTSVLYGIILLLCIFSLQKTARKNSIVPS